MCRYKPLTTGYHTEFRVNVKDIEGAKKWLEEYKASSKITYRVETTKPIVQPKTNIFKTYYRCQHNTLPRSSTADSRNSSKNTKCEAKMDITIKKLREPGKRCRAKSIDRHLPDFPMVVRIQHEHNHLIDSADALKFRDVSADTVEKFKNFFSKGHSPSSALNTHKMDLQMEHGSDYMYAAGDRAKCPSLAFCHKLYKEIFKTNYGAASGEKMIHDLEAAISAYNEGQGDVCAKIGETNGKIAIAVCTPMMKRIHEHHEYSGELVFIDASGGMDRYDCRVFMLLTHSAAGGLPLGCLITTSETRECVTLALNLYKDIVPDSGFSGNGEKGPLVFLTDDSESERQSLHTVYPDATLVLCVFHLLQAIWRYLWEGKNEIRKEHRPHLLFLVKAMAYSKTSDELGSLFEALNEDEVAKEYPNFLTHCEKLFDRRREWALCYREDLPTRGNNTNNYAEAAMRVLKDQIFERVRAYNVVQLLDFLLTRMPNYYERRLTDIANGRIDVAISRKYLPGGGVLKKEDVKEVRESVYECKSQSKPDVTYMVDMSISVCSCIVGMTGAPCKHQYAIVRHFSVSSLNFVPLHDQKMREHLLHLATGLQVSQVKPGWLVPLREGNLPASASVAESDQEDATFSADPLPSDVDDESSPPTTGSENAALDSLNQQRLLQNRFLGRNQGAIPLQSSATLASDSSLDANGASLVDNNNNQLASLETSLRDTAETLVSMLQKSPEEFQEPIACFIKQFNSLKTDSAMVGALKTFGKYTGASLALKKKRNPEERRRGKAIKVQPAAVSRRTTALGGRRCLQTGRKVTESCLNEKKRKISTDSCQLVPKKKPRKAPHALSKCVNKNESIGRNKSSKW